MIASINFVCSSDGEDNQTLFSQSFLVTLWGQGLVRYEGFSLLLQKLLSLMNAFFFFFGSFDFSATNRGVEISTRTSLLFFIKQQHSKYIFQVFFSFVFIVSSHSWQITAHASLNSFKLLPKKVIYLFQTRWLWCVIEYSHLCFLL